MSELLKMGRPNVSRCASDEGWALQNGDDPQRGIKTEDKPDGGQKVVLVGVKKCDACDENGKIIPNIECDLCENGFNHRKDGTAFKCRVCGKVCASRFAPCCKPDCPACGSKRDVKIDCPLCGGDKVITPLEEAKNKERVVPADTKQ